MSSRITAPFRVVQLAGRMVVDTVQIVRKEKDLIRITFRQEGVGGFIRAAWNRLRQDCGLGHLTGSHAFAHLTEEQFAERRENYLREMQAQWTDFLTSGEVLDFTPTATPRVSILLVLYNRVELTLSCLRSLQTYAGMPLEVILIDNASTDDTGMLLDRLRGCTVVRNQENRHFLRACNQAMELVQSEFLLFLNNDAALQEGALSEALGVFESEENIGAVGGRIVHVDGRLQEAGSIVWRDGSCWGVGRGDDPDDPAYLFRRDVDFCSGAFLLTRTEHFRRLGGFDERYAPAYYEETDYCMRLREQGLRVVYEPRASIVHLEFASSADSESAFDLQRTNRITFVERHRDALRAHSLPDPQQVLNARFAPPVPKRVLYIDDRVPHPELGSGYPRAKCIVDALVDQGCAVTLVPLNFPLEDSVESAHAVVSRRVEVIRGCGRADLGRFLASRPGYFDVLWVSRPDNMEIVKKCLAETPALASGLRVVYDAEALFSLREQAQCALKGSPMPQEQFARVLREEMTLTEPAEVIVSVSEMESGYFQQHRPDAEHVVIGHAVNVHPGGPSFEDRNDLLFVGNLQHDESPNVDAVVWFVESAWPRIQERIPGIRFHVIGAGGSSAIQKLNAPGVLVHGVVESLEPWYHQCRVFLAPTRFSAGIPLKVLEAASYGLPSVVSGALGPQLGWKREEDVLVAGDVTTFSAEEIAAQVERLYTDGEKWSRIREGGLSRVTSDHSHLALHRRVLEALGEQGMRSDSATSPQTTSLVG